MTNVGDLERLILWIEFTRIYIPFLVCFSYTYSHSRDISGMNDEERGNQGDGGDRLKLRFDASLSP